MHLTKLLSHIGFSLVCPPVLLALSAHIAVAVVTTTTSDMVNMSNVEKEIQRLTAYLPMLLYLVSCLVGWMYQRFVFHKATASVKKRFKEYCDVLSFVSAIPLLLILPFGMATQGLGYWTWALVLGVVLLVIGLVAVQAQFSVVKVIAYMGVCSLIVFQTTGTAQARFGEMYPNLEPIMTGLTYSALFLSGMAIARAVRACYTIRNDLNFRNFCITFFED